MNRLTKSQLTSFRRRLWDWFEKNQRVFLWRKNRDPYHVWVSEIMLQQTTTQTVTGFYDRFIERFPSVQSLAEANIDEVLRFWEGLGYYRRAHQLHQASCEIVQKYDGVFPDQYAQVIALPGIGRYTAGAILSIAFDQRAPILEANTIRLHARILGLETDPTSGQANKDLWEFAEEILPKSDCGLFNQALMDMGRLVCVPTRPNCPHCPVASFCEASKLEKQHFIPMLKKKKEKEPRIEIAVLIRQSDLRDDGDPQRFLLVQYPQHVRWGGLWDFPRFLYQADEQNESPNFKQNQIFSTFLSFDHASEQGEEGDFLKQSSKLIDSKRFSFQEINDLNSSFCFVLRNLWKLVLRFDSTRILFPVTLLKTIRHCVTHYKITLYFFETKPLLNGKNLCDDNEPLQDFLFSIFDHKSKVHQKSLRPVKKASKSKNILQVLNNESFIEFSSGLVQKNEVKTAWVTFEEIEQYPLSSTGRKMIESLKK